MVRRSTIAVAMRLLRILALLGAVCTALPGQELRVLKDVVYKKVDGVELKLDAYLWDWASLAPAVIYIHGGGWRDGDKSHLPEGLQERLFKNGISLISVNYRLTGTANYPAQVEDVTRAVQFVRHKAAEWHLGDRIAVMGFSAGAHLALWIGLHDDLANPESKDPIERESTRLAAIVNYSGPTDFHLLKTVKHGHPAYLDLFGLKPGDPPERIGDERLTHVSPISHVSPGNPPVLTYHGTEDQAVPIVHAHRLIKKLKANGVDTMNLLVEGAGHSEPDRAQNGSDVEGATLKFLKKHLRD